MINFKLSCFYLQKEYIVTKLFENSNKKELFRLSYINKLTGLTIKIIPKITQYVPVFQTFVTNLEHNISKIYIIFQTLTTKQLS